MCQHCGARLFHRETTELCCKSGKTKLPSITAPVELIELFSEQTSDGRHFRKNIRAYNHVFSFTSMGVHVDEQLAGGSRGVYTFRAQGTIYHRIGRLLPYSDQRPRFLQLYIYDTDHEVENRMEESNGLRQHIIEKIKNILDAQNPFVHTFRQMAQRPDIQDCNLILREQPPDRRQYNLPTASQVAAIVVGGDEAGLISGRDIVVQCIGGRLLNIQDIVGFYDPLQYPLLLPYGTYGWDVNSHNEDGTNCTCRDFYAYILQDAMALVQKYGKPDLFLTMTCNGNWHEIRNELLPGQAPSDRSDLVARVFRSKFEEFKDDILNKHVLGKVTAYVYVIENQKRGLPHAHILLILDENDKLKTPDDYDSVVRAEIPDKETEPELYNAVVNHMIHGPCGSYNANCPCMKNGVCKKKFPRKFANATTMGDDSYPVYRRRPPRPSDNGERIAIDNSWVVPYNPWLILKYNCHINVEICSSIISVKYLYKYVYKGPDRVSLEVRPAPNYDEIQQFVDARWVCASEAAWKIFKFPMTRMYPSVERLQIHLPNKQQVTFYCYQSIPDVLSNKRCARTMLTEFFRTNAENNGENRYLYSEFPQHYRWNRGPKKWTKRVGYNKVIGRIYTVSPLQGDLFYLRILLNHVRAPESWEDILVVDGVECSTFQLAAEQRGLLECDNSIRQCLAEASSTHMPSALRRMFVSVLVYCEPTGVRSLWNDFHAFMTEDYPSSTSTNSSFLINRLLKELNDLLSQHNRTISDYDLPSFNPSYEDSSAVPKIIQDELSISVSQQDLNSISALNKDQAFAFHAIIGTVERKENATYFVDGPGGTGKTFLYRAILASLRSQGHIALATASSGIAATLMPGGRTAHSRFKIPLNPDRSSVCSISKQSHLAELIRRASVILWDEATMTNRLAIEALDRTLRDIMDVEMPFGGKVMVFGGDFRQVLPVVPKGTKAETINASIAKSPLWRNVQVVRLKQNMRSVNDREFSVFLLRVGDGNEPTIDDEMMKVPASMVIPWENDRSIDKLIEENEAAENLNKRVNQKFSGRERVYYSFDKVENDPRNLYQQEFLNSISPGGLPPHELRLKEGAPIMLLRNLDPRNGLCNGTRLLCRALKSNFIDAEILTGAFKGTRTFLHRIPLKTPENMKLPFEMTRRQFPIRLSFALTINKAQGQTIPHVGIYLPKDVFSHGQLYVALSRGTSQNTTKILVKNGNIRRHEGVYAKNVVYKDVLLPSD
ncbi:hypothetical protein RHGRI_031907 [Rhododendron griersonianum]|uniref:ATP-dependent DNA helicase n=1 Tax=Rhododendron griersonianum TaxID=479676 RepID=A0AAV6IEE6_9ERIC|nr:hypothetical protein RHGRI_031907 [Rhododendron griersonianum]